VQIPWGLLSYALWCALLVAALVVAGLLMARRGLAGAGWGAVTLLGGLLTWAFVSAVIGLQELTAYCTRPAFFISLGVGTLGVFLFGLGCCRLRR
jgi:hypothetical protein